MPTGVIDEVRPSHGLGTTQVGKAISAMEGSALISLSPELIQIRDLHRIGRP